MERLVLSGPLERADVIRCIRGRVWRDVEKFVVVREIEITNASRPIDERERTACDSHGVRLIEVPVADTTRWTVVGPSSNDWATSMTIAEPKRLWEPAAEQADVGGIAVSPRACDLVGQRVAPLFADRSALGRNLDIVLSEAPQATQ